MRLRLKQHRNGRLELSNNRAERSMKPFVMGRKNWLFANTPAGAQSSAIINVTSPINERLPSQRALILAEMAVFLYADSLDGYRLSICSNRITRLSGKQSFIKIWRQGVGFQEKDSPICAHFLCKHNIRRFRIKRSECAICHFAIFIIAGSKYYNIIF